tara:strand:- start:815 stop:1342 length:528 start_codon:yes stop_codon:yes gene_type:complete
MPNINDFKARLAGGGARANQFKVTMPFPGYSAVGGETQQMAFLCQAAQLPGSTVGETPIPFRGRTLYIVGDREFEPWTVTVLNDTDFLVRNGLERWLNGMNNMTDNEGLTNPADYQVDAFVDQLDRNGGILKTYTFRGLFPTALSPIDLAYDTNNSVETFTCTFRYQYFETDTTT